MDLRRYSAIDWDPEDDAEGNLAHCMRPDRLGREPERLVHEVLTEQPVEIKFKMRTAEFAVVGPEHSRSKLWVILFNISHKHADWLRPVTGWKAELAEQRQWEKRRGKLRL